MLIYIAYCKSYCRGSAAIIVIFWAIRRYFEMSTSPSIMLPDCLSQQDLTPVLERTELHFNGKPQAMIAEVLNATHLSKIYAAKNLNHVVRPAHILQGLENCFAQNFSQ